MPKVHLGSPVSSSRWGHFCLVSDGRNELLQRNVAGCQIAGLNGTEIKHCQYVHAFSILRAKFLRKNGLHLSKPTFKSSVWVLSWTTLCCSHVLKEKKFVVWTCKAWECLALQEKRFGNWSGTRQGREETGSFRICFWDSVNHWDLPHWAVQPAALQQESQVWFPYKQTWGVHGHEVSPSLLS